MLIPAHLTVVAMATTMPGLTETPQERRSGSVVGE